MEFNSDPIKINNYFQLNQNNPNNKSNPASMRNTSKFHSNNNSFRQAESEFVSKALNEQNNLIISNNLISNDDWESISNQIMNSQTIQNIELSGTNITGYGLQMLADLLQRKNLVKTLKLEWNYMNENTDEFDYFCEIVGNVSSLTSVSLNNNKIGPVQAKSVAKLIKNSRSINSLDLRWNELGSDGARIIQDALSFNTKIQEVNLIGNKISNEQMSEINDFLQQNKTNSYTCHSQYLPKKEERLLSKSPVSYRSYNRSQELLHDREHLYYTQSQENEAYNPIPVKVVEKEKEISEEYKSRYDVQLIENARLEKKIKELEVSLSNEKAKFEEFQIEYNKELDFEKNAKLKYEDIILKLKEELMRKDIEINKLTMEFNSKLSEEIQKKSDIKNDNKLLTDKLDKIRDKYEEKFRVMEENFKKNTVNQSNNYENLRFDNDQLRRENNELAKTFNIDFEKKLMSFEESYRQINYKKEETDKENFHLKKELMELKLTRDMDNKERESKILEEEHRKMESVIKNFENKLKLLESARNESGTKIQNLQDEIYKIRKTFTDKELEFETILNALVLEKSTIKKENSTLSSENKKLMAEISNKETQINKSKGDISDLLKNNDQLSSNFNEKIEESKSFYLSDKKLWEREKNELRITIDDNLRLIENLKSKISKMESDDVKCNDQLKKAFTKMIDNSIKEKYKI